MAPQAVAEVELGAHGEDSRSQSQQRGAMELGKGLLPVPAYSTETRLAESGFPDVEILR